ncbi:MAG: hypothetical protein ACRD0C_08555 [Acidimicrobiia bacterium]
MSTALEEVAAVASDVADDQRRVARRALSMQRRRDQGWSWVRILDREPEPGMLGLLRGSARRLVEATGRLGQALVRGLTEEGESRRQVARRLGVTHQRISAMLRREPPPRGQRDVAGDG